MEAPKIGNYELGAKKPKNTTTNELVQLRNVEDRTDLHEGVDKYIKSIHPEKVRLYQEKYKENNDAPEAALSGTYFRDKFLSFIEKQQPVAGIESYKEPITMEDLFSQFSEKEGKKYAELYELALEEEMNSFEFRDAVLHASTEVYVGEKWKERPIVFVGGPSASGKSYAANSAIEKSTEFLSKDPDNKQGNEVIFVDGGIARSVSQVRKLALKSANNQGYAGIKDLNSHSQALRKTKRMIYNHAIKQKESGMVIPETFSAFLKPGDKSRKMLKDAMKLDNARTIFTRTKGKDPSVFQKVVQFMGSSRAWNKGEFKIQPIANLNAKTESESKAYGAGGFRWGAIGSKPAEVWFKRNCKENLSMVIVNDLVLKKLKDPKIPHIYEEAMPNDAGAIMVSQRVYDNWLATKPEETNITLEAYMDKDENKVPSIIYTSAEVKINIAKAELLKIIQQSEAKNENSHQLIVLKSVYDSLNNPEHLQNQSSIKEIQEKVQSALSVAKEEKRFGIDSPYKKLEKISKALTSLSKELTLKNNAAKEPEKLTTSTMMLMQSTGKPESNLTSPAAAAGAEKTHTTQPSPDASSALADKSPSQPVAAQTNKRPSIEGFSGIQVKPEDNHKELTKLLKYALTRYRDAYTGTLNKLAGLGASEKRLEDIQKFIDILNNPSINTADGLKKEVNGILANIHSDSSRLKDYVNSALKSYDLRVEKTFTEKETQAPRMK